MRNLNAALVWATLMLIMTVSIAVPSVASAADTDTRVAKLEADVADVYGRLRWAGEHIVTLESFHAEDLEAIAALEAENESLRTELDELTEDGVIDESEEAELENIESRTEDLVADIDRLTDLETARTADDSSYLTYSVGFASNMSLTEESDYPELGPLSAFMGGGGLTVNGGYVFPNANDHMIGASVGASLQYFGYAGTLVEFNVRGYRVYNDFFAMGLQLDATSVAQGVFDDQTYLSGERQGAGGKAFVRLSLPVNDRSALDFTFGAGSGYYIDYLAYDVSMTGVKPFMATGEITLRVMGEGKGSSPSSSQSE